MEGKIYELSTTVILKFLLVVKACIVMKVRSIIAASEQIICFKPWNGTKIIQCIRQSINICRLYEIYISLLYERVVYVWKLHRKKHRN